MKIYEELDRLCRYAEKNGLIAAPDAIYVRNRLLSLFRLEEWIDPQEEAVDTPDRAQETLDRLCDYAAEKGLIEDTPTIRDIFDTEIMGILTPFPSTVTSAFQDIRAKSGIAAATEWFYAFSRATNYIRVERIEKNLYWLAPTEYGDLEITINLSKPEKDPRDIAREKTAAAKSYPKCLLCYENVGYGGRINHPARQNHRAIPLSIDPDPAEKWYLQYSPYIYYNEHAIVFSGEHRPMVIDRRAFERILRFVGEIPHYFLGSNADLPIVGGSILTHDHYQGGNHEFPMAKAPVETPLAFQGYEDIGGGIVKWPMSVIRLRGENPGRLAELADKILGAWRAWSDPDCDILARTDDTPHNTITPIARRRGKEYELDLVLRNNRTTAEFPLGIFHPHAEVHNIKKENIGLIEVMGLAVLPGRLKDELALVGNYLTEKDGPAKIEADPLVAKHADWARDIVGRRRDLAPGNIREILREEVGGTILRVLEFAGVYKRTPAGREGFLKFIRNVNQI
ncbi:MAG: UDP-glucose--hexose-1-phosphate uridylyltransferase [Fusobacteriaceae bacterium]|jgi:UDPglucose--hexose-1-phosphate uridylyltransferase|nr:UDP-glucose--hexose-1-phosphate uridylyltransferase [Fusobacteriaceae bacterium]